MSGEQRFFDVVVVGAGLTGLTTAWHLRKAGVTFRVLEKSDRPGGVIRTVCAHGFQYECGPNSGIIGQPEVVELFDELQELEPEVADAAVNKRYILKRGRWEALPSGAASAIRTPLFTLRDKFRILGEPFRRRGSDPDETLDRLVLRRMGPSFLDYAIDPFILGVYAGDPSKLVTRHAFPKLYNLEQNYGSFIGGSIKKRREPKSDIEKRVSREVFSCKGGLQSLTDLLYRKVGEEQFIMGVGETTLRPVDGGYEIKGVRGGEPFLINAKRVITAVNGPDLDALIPFMESGDRTVLSSVFYAPTVEVVLGFDRWEGRSLDAFGGLIPHRENRNILGILFLSACFKNRAPEGGALLTVFMGGVRRSEWIDASDDQIRTAVADEVSRLMELKRFDPVLFKILRHHQAIPQYSHESDEKIRVLEKIEREHPGLIIGGNILQGIGMADRIRQGRLLAEKALI